MATYSTNLALTLMATGEQSNTWGDTTNTNLGTLLEQAISGYVTQAITDGSSANTTITIPNGTTGVARNMFIEMTGALTFSTTSLIVPANKKLYFVYNNTTGGFAVTVKVTGQTGVSVPNGKKVVLVSNGTDIVSAENYIASLSVGALTSGRVPYAGTSGLLQDAANLTFNGTTLTANTIGAFTLSGTVAGGGNQLNNVIIGTTNPLAGAFTTGTFSSTLGVTGVATLGNGAILGTPASGTVTNLTGTFSGAIGVTGALTLSGGAGLANATYLSWKNAAGTFTAGSAGASFLKFSDNNFYVDNFEGDSIYRRAASAETMRLTSAGLVGIGTSSPSSYGRLAVMTPTTNYGVLGLADSVGGGGGMNIAQYYGTTKISYIDCCLENGTPASEAARLTFATINAGTLTERMRITSAGLVGIGTATPAHKLDVATASGNAYINVARNALASGQVGLQINGGTSGTAWFVYTPVSSNDLAFFGNGSETMRFTSTSRVGIGTASPDSRLTIEGTANNVNSEVKVTGTAVASGYLGSNSDGFNIGTDSYGIVFKTGVTGGGSVGATGTERMRITSGGNVGIGTATPNVNLEVYNATSVAQRLTAGSNIFEFINNSTENRISAIAALPLTFRTSNTEYMRIDSSGNVEIGITTAAPAKFTVSGQGGSNVWVQNNINTGTSAIVSLGFSNANGLVGYVQTSGSATSYVTSSDYRLKQHIQPMIGALAKVAQLKPVTYKWKVDGSNGQGFIAHELQEVVPDCVSGEKDATREEEYEVIPAVPAVVDVEGIETTPAVQAVKGTRIVPSYQGVDTSFLVATLTAAIQELKAIIDTQATRITALENK